jgi:hypothetical protein
MQAGAGVTSAHRPCPTAAFRDAGSFTWAAGGTLRAIDLRTCRVRVLVSRGAVPPVRISPDGRWVGFGPGSIVPIGGGRVRHPLGAGVASWEWSPQFGCKPGYGCTPVRLAGVTRRGAVVEDTLGSRRQVLFPSGFGAGQLLYDGSGGTLLVVRARPSRPDEIWGFDLTARRARLIYRVPGTASVILATTSKVFALVAFWVDPGGSASLAADGLPLRTVSSLGGGSRSEPVGRASLVYRDFLTSCDLMTVLVSGTGRDTTTNKRLVMGWLGKTLEPVAPGRGQAFVSPTCASGTGLAASAGPSGADRAGFGHERRRIWLVTPHLRRLTTARDPWVTDEQPRFSAGGDLLTFVRTDGRTGAGGLDVILHPAGRHPRVVGPIVELGRTGNYFGHYGWAASTDYHW